MDAAAILVASFVLLPLALVAAVAVETGWASAAALLWRPRIGDLLINTACLVMLAVPVAAVIGLGSAWLTERSDIPGARVWRWLAVAPLAIPAFLHGYAWTSIAPALSGLPAGLLLAVLAYSPFMYLPLAATLRRLDPALEESAAALGDAPIRVFRRVVLPQLKLAFCGGALLVGLHLLAEYGLFAMVRFDTFTTAIVDQFQSTYNGASANMMAGVLILICVAFLAAETTARGRARLARLGPGASRVPVKSRLRAATGPAVLVLSVLAALSIGVPLVTLARWLLVGGGGVWRSSELLAALGQSLGLAAAGALVTVMAAMPMAWLSVRRPTRRRRLLESAYYVAGAIPGVVIALGFVTVAVRVALPLYQTLWTLIGAYGVMFLPRALVGLRASFAQVPVELEQAAASLGQSPGNAFRRVTLRLAAPGAAAGAALVGLGITNELVATQMLAPNGVQTLATAFWSFSGELDYAAAAPYGLLMVVLSLPLTWLLRAASELSAAR